MKKNIFLVEILLICLCLSGCVGLNDWNYELYNGYEIARLNSKEIILIDKNATPNQIALYKYIIEFCYNEQFVCLKVVEISEGTTIDTSCPQYYIVNMVNDTIYGGFDEGEFLKEQKALNIGELSAWLSTVPNPEGAVFPGDDITIVDLFIRWFLDVISFNPF